METGDLNVPQSAAIRIAVERREDGRLIDRHTVAELLGVTAREVGIVIRLDGRPRSLGPVGPLGKVAMVLVQKLRQLSHVRSSLGFAVTFTGGGSRRLSGKRCLR
jgi:hypothetical protein